MTPSVQTPHGEDSALADLPPVALPRVGPPPHVTVDKAGSSSSSVSGLKAPRTHSFKKASHPPGRPIHEHKHFHWILGGSLILCFNAGFVNSITLHTFHKAPSAHVTGMVARASDALVSGDWHLFFLNGVSWLSFLVGACISGMVVSYESFYLGRAYGRVLFLVALVLSVALVIEDSFDDSVLLIFCCSVACGLQNGITSKYSGNAVRTTHLTGTTTDLGIAVGHIIKGRADEVWKVKMHVTSIIGFFMGGCSGWMAFEYYEHAALLTSIVLTASAGLVHTLYLAYHEQISVLRVLESDQDFRIYTHGHPPPRGDDESSTEPTRWGRTIASPRSLYVPSPQSHYLSSPRSLFVVSRQNSLRSRDWAVLLEEGESFDDAKEDWVSADGDIELTPEEAGEEEYEVGDVAREEEEAANRGYTTLRHRIIVLPPDTGSSSCMTW